MKEKKNHSIFFFFFPSALYRIKLIKALSRPLTCLYFILSHLLAPAGDPDRSRT